MLTDAGADVLVAEIAEEIEQRNNELSNLLRNMDAASLDKLRARVSRLPLRQRTVNVLQTIVDERGRR